MRIILVFLIIFGLASCTQEQKTLVKERYDSGAEKIVLKFIGDTTHLVSEIQMYPTGKMMSEVIFEEGGKQKSSEKTFHPDGKVKVEGMYQNGLRNGVWKAYFPNGDLQSVRNYGPDGLEEGMSQVYSNKDGDYYLFYSGYYSKGQKKGTWYVYNKDGDIINTSNH